MLVFAIKLKKNLIPFTKMVSTKSSVDELKLIDLKFCSLLDQCPPASFLYQLYSTLKQ